MRVVISGLGLVSPLGNEIDEFWRRLLAGERGLTPIERFDPAGLRNEKAGEVKGWTFDVARFGMEAAPSLATQFALSAAADALADAKLATPVEDRAGLLCGTNFAGADRWEEYAAGFLAGDPRGMTLAGAAFDEGPIALRKAFGLHGPMGVVSIACSSGTEVVGHAADWVREGRCDFAVAGAYDCLSPTLLAGLSALHTITADDIKPFSADRSGTMFGEGAAFFVIEPLERAEARGAKAYAEILGWWQNNNGYHITAPDPGAEGMTAVVAGCMKRAGLTPADVDYINAHGTGTEHHDPAETHAIKNVLGARAYEIPVSSIKGAMGHLMGAAGAIEAAATALAVSRGAVPPTASYTTPDPECDLDYVPKVGREADVRTALSISAGIGGSNACLALRSLRRVE
jgi:3-oxoacyl-(acyl-carrier-protein) synthase